MSTIIIGVFILALMVFGAIFWLQRSIDLRTTMFHFDNRPHRRQMPRVEVLSPYLEVRKDTAVVVQKTGLIQKTIAFRGPDLAASNDDIKDRLSGKINEMMMRKGSGWAYHFEAQRTEVSSYDTSEYPSLAHRIIEEERADHFTGSGKYFDSDFYLTIVYAPKKDAQRGLMSFLEDKEGGASLNEEISLFVAEVGAMASELATYMSVAELSWTETVSYLHTAVSWNWFPMMYPDGHIFLDSVLFDCDVQASGDLVVVGDRITKIITVKGFPSSVYPGILDGLNSLGFPYRWTSRWVAYDFDEAEKKIQKHQSNFFAGRTRLKDAQKKSEGQDVMVNEGAEALQQATKRAHAALADGRATFGELSVTIQVAEAVIGEDVRSAEQRLARKAAEVMTVLNTSGFSGLIEGMNALEAWRGMFPGNTLSNPRRFLFPSAALADIIPITAVWRGRRPNLRMEQEFGNGAPLVTTATRTTTPFYLNGDFGDVRHKSVTGQTGAGKTVLCEMLALAHNKLRNKRTKAFGRTYYFDLDRSTRQVAMATGATRYEPAVKDSALRWAFQPLHRLETQGDLAWASGFIESLIVLQGLEVPVSMRREIMDALKVMSGMEKKNRTMTTFKQTVQHEVAGQNVIELALRPYCSGGEYGDIFDADSFELSQSFLTVIEMRSLLDRGEKAAFPAMDFLTREIELTVDYETPIEIIIDEAWIYFEYPRFVNWIMSLYNTGRKKKVSVTVCTQSLGAILKSNISDSVLLNCPVKFILADEGAEANADVYSKFNLSEAEIRLVARSQAKVDYVFKSPEGTRQFQLALGPKTMKLLFGCPHSVLDSLEGLPPEDVCKFLLEYVA